MLGQSPISSAPLSALSSLPTTHVYPQTLSATSSNSTSPLLKSISKILGGSSSAQPIQTSAATLPTLGVNNTSVGTLSWTNPTNIYTTNSTYAVGGSTTSGSLTNYLVATTFGFSIPLNAIITGVSATYATNNSTSTTGGFYALASLWNGSSTTIDNSIGNDLITSSTFSNNTVFGGINKSWGATLTPTIVNSSTFGVALSIFNQILSIDSVTLTIYYTIGAATQIYKQANRSYLATSVYALGASNQNIAPSYFSSTVQQQTSGSLVTWSNPDYARLNDGNSATIASDGSSGSHDLIFELSDLTSIPSNALITGIQLSVTGQTSNISDGFGAQFGNNTLTTTAYYGTIGAGTSGFDCYFSASGTPQTLVWGGSTNNWSLTGTQLTGAWWNGSNSSINIWSTGVSGAAISIENVVIQVWYQVPLTNIVKSALKSLVVSSVNGIYLLAAKLGGGGTTYYQTISSSSINSTTMVKSWLTNLLSATSVSSNTLSKQDIKSFSLTSANGTSLIKQDQKTFPLSSADNTSISKQDGKLLSLTDATSISLIKQEAKLFSLTSINNTTLIKQIAKLWSIVSINATSLFKQDGKILGVTSVNSTSLLAKIIHLLNLSVTSVNNTTLAKQLGKILTSLSVNNTSFGKQIGKILNPISVNTTTLFKQSNKPLSTSSINVVALLARIVHLLNLSVASVNSTTLAKQIGKILNPISINSTKLIKSISKTLNVSSINTTLLIKQIGKILNPIGVNSTLIQKQDQKTFGLTSVNSTSFIKKCFKILGILSINNTSFVKFINKLVSITSINNTTLGAHVLRFLTLSVSSVNSTSLVKQSRKLLNSFSINFSTFIKNVNKLVNIISISFNSLVNVVTHILPPINITSNILREWAKYAMTIFNTTDAEPTRKDDFNIIIEPGRNKGIRLVTKLTTETIDLSYSFSNPSVLPYSATANILVYSGVDNNPSALLYSNPIVENNQIIVDITGGLDGVVYKIVLSVTLQDGTIKVVESYLPVSAT